MTFIWGTNFSIVKRAFVEMDPQAFNAVRMIIASAVFLALMKWMPGRSRQVTSMPPPGPSATPPLASVGTSAASSG